MKGLTTVLKVMGMYRQLLLEGSSLQGSVELSGPSNCSSSMGIIQALTRYKYRRAFELL
jgi:hypothetical protein